MNYHKSTIYCVVFFAFLTAFVLSSCGGGNLAAVKANTPASISAQRNIPDNDIDIAFNPDIMMAQDGGITLLRRDEAKKMVIEHYSPDTLGVDWSVPLECGKEDYWYPLMHYKNGLLYCFGSMTFSDGDSTGLRLLVIDPKTHSIQHESWIGKSVHSIPSSWDPLPTLSSYIRAISPDSNLILFYRTDNRPLSEVERNNTIKFHCDLYQSDGTLKKSFDISISTSDAKPSDAELALLHRGIEIDNEGNIYNMTFAEPDKFQVTKYSSANAGAPVTLTANFQNSGYKSGYKIGTPTVSFDPATNAMTLTAAREKIYSGLGKESHNVLYEGSMRGLVHATFDFAGNKVQAFQYDPTSEFLEKLIDQKHLSFYGIVKESHDNANGNTYIFLEKREKGTSSTTYTPGGGFARNWTSYTVSHPFNYCYGLLLLSFDNTGKPLWQTPLPKDQDETHEMDYFFKQANGSAINVYYVDRDAKLEGLQKSDLNLATGALSEPQNILQFESDTYMLTNFTFWQNPKTAILFATGSTTFGGQLRLRNQLIFKLTTQ